MPEGPTVESQIELYDSDLKVVHDISRKLNDRFKNKPDSLQNYRDLVSMAEELFRAAGFEITVALPRHALRAMGMQATKNAPAFFTINIAARIAPFDHERQAFEVKQGLADPFWERKRKEMPKGKPQPPGPEHKH